MEIEKGTSRIFGTARIINYVVDFETVSYIIVVKECSLETRDRIEDLNDYSIEVIIPFTEEHKLIHWLRNPAFAAMQESYRSAEEGCYFEHSLGDRAALMTLNGSVVLIPVMNP